MTRWTLPTNFAFTISTPRQGNGVVPIRRAAPGYIHPALEVTSEAFTQARAPSGTLRGPGASRCHPGAGPRTAPRAPPYPTPNPHPPVEASHRCSVIASEWPRFPPVPRSSHRRSLRQGWIRHCGPTREQPRRHRGRVAVQCHRRYLGVRVVRNLKLGLSEGWGSREASALCGSRVKIGGAGPQGRHGRGMGG